MKLTVYVLTGMFMRICMLVAYGQVQKLLKIPETSLLQKFRSAVLWTLLSCAVLRQEALFLHWGSYSPLVRIIGKTYLSWPVQVYIELLGLVGATTLAPKKMLHLLPIQFLFLLLLPSLQALRS